MQPIFKTLFPSFLTSDLYYQLWKLYNIYHETLIYTWYVEIKYIYLVLFDLYWNFKTLLNIPSVQFHMERSLVEKMKYWLLIPGMEVIGTVSKRLDLCPCFAQVDSIQVCNFIDCEEGSVSFPVRMWMFWNRCRMSNWRLWVWGTSEDQQWLYICKVGA